MSTEASETPSIESSVIEFKVIFATDGDTAEIVTDVLTNADCEANVFCLLHTCYLSNIPGDTISLTLCLPAKRPGGNNKCLPVLQITIHVSKAIPFLFHGKPLSVKDIQTHLNLKSVKKYFKPILDVLTCTNKTTSKQHEDLRSKIYWFRTKFVVALRKMFKITASPFWMVTTFGSFEIPFILVSSFYFFETHDCTIETLTHLANLFETRKGKSTVTINSFGELACMFGTSEWLCLVPKFSSFVKKKLDRDDLESYHLDATINTFRGQLMLSNTDLIHYIYLSFFQCFNKNNFLSYTLKTNPENIESIQEDPMLIKFIDGTFKEKMSTYYNKCSYLNNHIYVEYINLPFVEGYSKETTCMQQSNILHFWKGQSRDVQNLMSDIQTENPCLKISSELQGLIDLAAIGPEHEICEAKLKIFETSRKNPVYRCQFLNKNFFVMVNQDTLSAVWKNTVLLPVFTDWFLAEDKEITAGIYYKELMFSTHSIKDQLSVSRHEYFNPRLPVFNLILDFDLPIKTTGISLDYIYSLCLTIRDDITKLLKLLGDINEETHPIYFFKSSCPQSEWELDQKKPFCSCSEKLGFRIITPLPRGTVIVGTKPLVSIAKILNRLVKMHKEIFSLCPTILDLNGPFDTGIYNKGRCVRLPHTYKVNIGGGLERLLKIIVCHPNVPNKKQYVEDALDLQNLLYHSYPRIWERKECDTPNSQGTKTSYSYPGHHTQEIKTFFDIRDINEDFLLEQIKQQLPKSHKDIENKIETMTGSDLINWVSSEAWPKIFQNIKLYLPDDKTFQFHYVKFIQTGSNIIQLKPQRGNNFLCITNNHKNKTQTVRVFLTFYASQDDNVTITLMSQCFASRCNNNKPRAHFSIQIPLRRDGLD
ncbi:helicase-primase primase subunit [Vespertilionid gammaherpesvirus 1]|uniref:Helicase-primase primase subunit n=1 Tax=Vespertilionid gammaherpesvirus 1 TaxID=2560830 RepID=A0A0X9XD60_9GAMA|nr:helicase-primase primase subunit [Myotis gammaherpesvirus 8]AMA67411.1 helicase-primase primase subunit [Vespertilionid gammaherpesvirus 1]